MENYWKESISSSYWKNQNNNTSIVQMKNT